MLRERYLMITLRFMIRTVRSENPTGVLGETPKMAASLAGASRHEPMAKKATDQAKVISQENHRKILEKRMKDATSKGACAAKRLCLWMIAFVAGVAGSAELTPIVRRVVRAGQKRMVLMRTRSRARLTKAAVAGGTKVSE